MDKGTSAVCMGVVGAAVAASIYVLWGPDNLLLRRKGQCTGLQNLGNTCFMNAVLQALASTESVLEWIESLHGGRLTAALHNTLHCLHKDGKGTTSPAAVLQALVWHGWSLNHHQQQDAYELYHVLLTTLAEESRSYSSLLDGLHAEVSGAVVYSRVGPISSIPLSVTCPLQGLISSSLLCLTCQQKTPVKYEVFDSLSLNLPLQTQCSLHSCLLDFIKSEVMMDVECCTCSQSSGSTVKQTHTKQLQIARAPPILCLHFKRTLWLPSGTLHKNMVSVVFPLHLDLSGLSNTWQCSYELVALIEHVGGPFSGHYVTYRYFQGRQWVQTSDTAVYSCSLHDVLRTNPYMLFYSKVK